jgi:hypothetical protein
MSEGARARREREKDALPYGPPAAPRRTPPVGQRTGGQPPRRMSP